MSSGSERETMKSTLEAATDEVFKRARVQLDDSVKHALETNGYGGSGFAVAHLIAGEDSKPTGQVLVFAVTTVDDREAEDLMAVFDQVLRKYAAGRGNKLVLDQSFEPGLG